MKVKNKFIFTKFFVKLKNICRFSDYTRRFFPLWSVICVSQPQQVISVPTGTPLCKITTKRLVNSFHSNRWATTLYIFPVSIILLCRLQHCFFRENNTRDFQKIYNFWIHHLGSISKKIFAVLMEWGCKLYTEITYEGNLIPFFTIIDAL